MTRLLIATTNRDKLREINAVLDDPAFDLMTLADLPPIREADETGETFQDNARLKALYYAQAATEFVDDPSLLTVAEDSGLVVDVLAGEPGVHSARFLRPDATYAERFAEIYRRLADLPDGRVTARFICALTVVRGTSIVYETTGTIEGEIAPEPRGGNGFGYDPIFFYPPYRSTLAEVDAEKKMRVAHRGAAFRKLGEWLRKGM